MHRKEIKNEQIKKNNKEKVQSAQRNWCENMCKKKLMIKRAGQSNKSGITD